MKYLGSTSIAVETDNNGAINAEYLFCAADGTGRKNNVWYVGHRFNKDSAKVKEKVAAKAASLGLLGGEEKSWPKPTAGKTFTAEDNIAWMHIVTIGE